MSKLPGYGPMIKREVDHATDAAEQAPYPDPSTFDRHVYADG